MTHGCSAIALPSGAQSRPPLPKVEARQVCAAIAKLSARTSTGPLKMAPRALMQLSAPALEALAYLFNKCEVLLAWPSERV